MIRSLSRTWEPFLGNVIFKKERAPVSQCLRKAGILTCLTACWPHLPWPALHTSSPSHSSVPLHSSCPLPCKGANRPSMNQNGAQLFPRQAQAGTPICSHHFNVCLCWSLTLCMCFQAVHQAIQCFRRINSPAFRQHTTLQLVQEQRSKEHKDLVTWFKRSTSN